MAKPLVSFVMPIWNVAYQPKLRWLENALLSIVDQDYAGKIELLLIDDGSSDSTLAELARISKSKSSDSREFRILRHPHAGVTKSLNLGLRESRGEIICRLDSDDLARKDRVSRQVSFLNEHDAVYLLSSAIRILRSDTLTQEVWYTLTNPVSIYQEFRKSNPICHSSVAFRRQVLKSVGFYDEQYRHAQDYDLWWRIAKKYLVAGIPDCLTLHRLHRDRVTERSQSIQHACSARIKARINSELRR
jgi:glycosyltransferase involved in cell wall biosynthesis